MTTRGLDVFSLRDTVVTEYKQFATSFTTIHAADIRQQIDAIYASDQYWPEPLIQINPNYRRTTTVEKLAADGVVHPRTAEIFRGPGALDGSPGPTLSLYKHQQQAIALAAEPTRPSGATITIRSPDAGDASRVASGTRPERRQPAGSGTHAPAGPGLPGLVRPAPRMALHEPEPGTARPPDHRIRIEHAQVLRPADVPRIAKLGLIASWQWMHCTLDMPWAEKRVGPERIRTAYAWRTLIETGARLVGGSDGGPKTFSPFMGIHAAVTRQGASGSPAGGWYPAQRLTREEALRSYTLDAAYVAFQEASLGSLTPGRLADLVVLSKDTMTVPSAELLTTEALLTMVGGEVVFERTAMSSR